MFVHITEVNFVSVICCLAGVFLFFYIIYQLWKNQDNQMLILFLAYSLVCTACNFAAHVYSSNHVARTEMAQIVSICEPTPTATPDKTVK